MPVEVLFSAKRSFNAATARSPWRTSGSTLTLNTGSTLLQCGHGLRAVENLRRHWLRTESRFNAATAFGPWRTAVGP